MAIEDVRGSSAVWVGPFSSEPTRPKIEAIDGRHWVEFDGGVFHWGSSAFVVGRIGPYNEEPDAGKPVVTHGGIHWLVFEDHVPEWAEPFVMLGAVFDDWGVGNFRLVQDAECAARLERLMACGLDAAASNDFDRYRCAYRSRSFCSGGRPARTCGRLDDVGIMSAVKELESREGLKVYHVAEHVEDKERFVDCVFVPKDFDGWLYEETMLEMGFAHVYRIDLASPSDAQLCLASIDVADGCVVVRSAAPVAG